MSVKKTHFFCRIADIFFPMLEFLPTCEAYQHKKVVKVPVGISYEVAEGHHNTDLNIAD